MEIVGTEYKQVALPKGALTAANIMSSDGFNAASRKVNQNHKLKLLEATRMWSEFMCGEIDPYLMKEAFNPTRGYAFSELCRKAPHIFTEAMTRSDFSNLTTYVLDRMMLENYAQFPFIYSQIARVHRKVRDFRTVERWVTDGGERTWQVVEELEGFNRGKVDTSKYNYTVQKYEGGDQISWEAVINDDMDMFETIPKRLALGGGRTIELFFTKLIADINGPHASFYNTGNKNIIDTTNYAGGSVNPPLNYNSLAGALAQFMNLMTADGRPINAVTGGVKVMVGDGMLYQTLMNIINTQFIATTVAGGSKANASVMYDTLNQIKNWLAGRITPVYNPELRGVTTANSGANISKCWWIFADNEGLTSRPAIEIGHLLGYDAPQLFRKLPNTVRISGGAADELGDWETMGTEVKGLVVVGGTRMDPKMTLSSNGQGS